MIPNYEHQLLGRIIADKDAYYQNADMIHRGLFLKHPELYDAIMDLFRNDKVLSAARLISLFPEKQDVVIDITSDVDYTIPMAEILHELQEAHRNYIINNGMAKAGMQKDADNKINVLSEMLLDLEKNGTQNSFVKGYDLAKAEVESILEDVTPGYRTGFSFFDGLTGGLQKSDLVIIAAESSQGKTALSLNIAQNLIDSGKGVAFISLEMSKGQIMWRMMCSKLEIPRKNAKTNYERFLNIASEYHSRQFYVADISNSNYMNIVSMIRSARFRLNIQCVFVDYLQLIRDGKMKSREQEVGSIARGLKNLAKELDMPIVLLSQLSRPQGHDHRPTMGRLRDSGQIEEAADVVWFVYRPEVYDIQEYQGLQSEGLAEHIIAKGRNYGTTKAFSSFKSSVAKFIDRGNQAQPGADPLLEQHNKDEPF